MKFFNIKNNCISEVESKMKIYYPLIKAEREVVIFIFDKLKKGRDIYGKMCAFVGKFAIGHNEYYIEKGDIKGQVISILKEHGLELIS